MQAWPFCHASQGDWRASFADKDRIDGGVVRRIVVRVVIGIVVLVAVVAAAGGGFFWAMTSHFNPAPPALDYPRPASALEAQHQDIDYFRKLVALDRSFSSAARADAAHKILALESSTTVLPTPKLRVALM